MTVSFFDICPTALTLYESSGLALVLVMLKTLDEQKETAVKLSF